MRSMIKKRNTFNSTNARVSAPITVKSTDTDGKEGSAKLNVMKVRTLSSASNKRRILIMAILGGFGGKSLSVIAFLLNHMDKNGLVKMSNTTVHKMSGIGYTTVAQTMKKLHVKGFILKRKYHDNRIQFTPNVYKDTDGILLKLCPRQ